MPPLDRRGRWVLGLLVAAGAAVRLAWAIGAAWRPTSLRDPALYLILSEQVANGDGYVYPGADGGVTAFYPPGYPVALGGVQWLVGLLPDELSSFGVAIGFNLVLSVLTIALVFELGRRLVSVPVGLIAAAVFAFWPNLVVHSGLVLTETLFLFLLVVMLLVALASPEVARAPGRGRMLTVGVLFGMVGLVRPTSLVIAPLFLVLWWRQGVALALRRTALVGVGALALVLPWTVRNAVRMDSFVLVSTNVGDNICIGNHPGADGSYELPDPPCNLGLTGEVGERPQSEITRQSDNLDIASRYVRDDPLVVLTKMPAKLRYTLDRDTDGLWGATDYGARPLWTPRRFEWAKWVADIYYYVIGVVAVIGGALLFRRQDPARRRLFLLLIALVQLVPPLLTFGDPRFKMPAYPAVAIGVGVAVMALLQRRLPALDVEPESRSGSTASRSTPEPADDRVSVLPV
jgi:4-amino-4-deoxy-L-arabinose transferase-like glycosyltransferase